MNPPQSLTFLMAGGGTGGHVIPALAVAQELRLRGHQPFFIGTRRGLEAKLVPPEGFQIEWIEIGGLKGVGVKKRIRTLGQLPVSILRVAGIIGRRRPAGIFSMGGYVAGPAMIAAALRGIPLVVMEPNAMPGFTARWMARWIDRALVSFEEAARHFPGKAEISGLPVRAEFFAVPEKPLPGPFTVLITGGSQGSRTLNRAARDSWKHFREAQVPVALLHQTGPAAYEELATEFAASGLEGRVVPFIQDMPGAFAQAAMVISRSGAGAVAELAAAGKPGILVPFPFAADEHQLKNAQAMQRAGAARLVLDQEFDGERMAREVTSLLRSPDELVRIGNAARSLARPGAARRAADVLEQLAARE
jgi:UDP-N-acetylglucosamine--N-acetylmuramyl-(pentapeptide) pyrophosphoryl-undecaprenol N-acetylglucosamine transferase